MQRTEDARIDTIAHFVSDGQRGLSEQALQVRDGERGAVLDSNIVVESGKWEVSRDIRKVSVAKHERARNSNALQPAGVKLERDIIVDYVDEATEPSNSHQLARLDILAPNLSVDPQGVLRKQLAKSGNGKNYKNSRRTLRGLGHRNANVDEHALGILLADSRLADKLNLSRRDGNEMLSRTNKLSLLLSARRVVEACEDGLGNVVSRRGHEHLTTKDTIARGNVTSEALIVHRDHSILAVGSHYRQLRRLNIYRLKMQNDKKKDWSKQ